MKPLTIVCTDFSACSEHALLRAAELTAGEASRVLIVHVCDPPGALSGSAPWDETPLRKLREARQKYFAELSDNDVQYDAVANSHAARTICGIAKDNRAALIVLGSHGRTGMIRQLLGSVAENVVRHAPCSVLVVRKATTR